MARIRRSAEETRELMVEAGFEILQHSGLTLGLDHVTLEAACRAKDIPRSSSHSAWSTDENFSPQEVFRRTVVKAWLFEREGSLFQGAARDAAIERAAELGDISPEEFNRVGSMAAFELALRANPHGIGDYLSTDLAIRYALASQPIDDRDQEMFGWLSDGERNFRDQLVEDIYKPLCDLLNYVPRPEFGEDAYRLYAVVIGSLIEGLSLRALLLPELNLIGPIPGTENDSVPMSVFAACTEAVLNLFFQQAPDVSPEDEA